MFPRRSAVLLLSLPMLLFPASTLYCDSNASPAAPAATAPAASDASAQIASGKALFQKLTCTLCHKPAGQKALGPTLEGLYGRTVTLDNGKTVTADDAYLRESILDSKAKIVKGYGPIMTDFKGKITPQQLDDLVAYIKSLAAQPSPDKTGAAPSQGSAASQN